MDYLTPEELKLFENMKATLEERRRLSETMHCLGFTNILSKDNEPVVLAKELWEVLSSEEKIKQLVSRLKNKAFW